MLPPPLTLGSPGCATTVQEQQAVTEEGPPTPTSGLLSILKLRGDPEATGMSVSPNSLSGVQNLDDFRNDRAQARDRKGVCVCVCTHLTRVYTHDPADTPGLICYLPLSWERFLGCQAYSAHFLVSLYLEMNEERHRHVRVPRYTLTHEHAPRQTSQHRAQTHMEH